MYVKNGLVFVKETEWSSSKEREAKAQIKWLERMAFSECVVKLLFFVSRILFSADKAVRKLLLIKLFVIY